MGQEKDAAGDKPQAEAAQKEAAKKSKWAETCERWALSVSTKGGSWWMPFVLLAVVTLNTISAGALIWIVGVLQAALFAIIVMSRKYTFFLGPLTLSAGCFIGGEFAIRTINTFGADEILDKAGLKGHWLLQKSQDYAQHYGVWGLLAVQLSPFPTPTALICAAGTLAGLDRWMILATLTTSKFIQMMISAVMLRVFTSGMSPEDYIRKMMAGENPLNDCIMASLQPQTKDEPEAEAKKEQ
mmetsp:Transcript_20165/g.36518  ORF Transcript_20165/g.36518 Transcript_20165/m.36518 type:complete len:241 (-) Transcript_20165:141-863(-)